MGDNAPGSGEPYDTGEELPRASRAGRRALARGGAASPGGAAPPGIAALAGWARAHAQELRLVAQQRDADGPMVERALEIVRQFVAARGLILFGGLAIDYALRLKGARIYPDGERPDFDFLSPRSVDDAYDLADIFQRAGFERVGTIRAIHVQTMRVRVNFVYVADIGYAPREVFDRIPTLEWEGLRVAHPDYQRMDQLLAFCFPFSNPPFEDIYHRWRKDLERFNLYEEFYPVAGGAGAGAAGGATLEGRLAVPVAGPPRDLVVALHGFAAYSVIRTALDDLAAAFGAPAATGAPRLALAFPDAHSLAVETPAGGAIHVVSPAPAAATAGLPGARWHDPYMDLAPESVQVGAVRVLSTQGRLLAASTVAVGPPAAGGERASVRVVTPQYLLMHFLLEAHRAPDEGSREVYRAFYRHTLDILRAAAALFAARLAALGDAEARAALMREFVLSPFGPTVRTIGTVNHDAAYVIKMATYAQKLRDTPPPELQLGADPAALLAGLPQNYYPDGAKSRPPAFDYGASPLFRRAGEARPD